MKTSFKLAVGAAAVMLSLNANAVVVIDLFTTNQATLSDNDGATGGAATSSVSGAGILGGERDLSIDQVAQDLAPGELVDPDIESSIGVFNSRLNFSNDTGAMGIGVVQWDGPDGSPVLDADGLGGVDLTAGGSLNAFLVETISSDADWNFEVGLYTDDVNYAIVSFAATSVPTGTGPVFTAIPFIAFTDLCGVPAAFLPGGINEVTCVGTLVLADLGAIELILNSPTTGVPSAFDIDLRLANLTTIPEPGVLALMGMGLMAAGLASRRRKSQA